MLWFFTRGDSWDGANNEGQLLRGMCGALRVQIIVVRRVFTLLPPYIGRLLGAVQHCWRQAAPRCVSETRAPTMKASLFYVLFGSGHELACKKICRLIMASVLPVQTIY